MDPGDEDDYREPPLDRLSAMLAEWDDPSCVVASLELFQAMNRARAMRDCCSACALEVNGEDGS